MKLIVRKPLGKKSRSPKLSQSRSPLSALSDLYANEGDWPRLPKQPLRSRPGRWWRLALPLLVLAGVGYWWFRPAAPATGEAVSIKVEQPSSVALGELVTYQVKVTNEQAIALTNLNLGIIAPAGWSGKTVEPASASDRRLQWSKETLASGETWSLTLSGYLFGEAESRFNWRAELFYQPVNFNSPFRQVTDWTTVLTGSQLALDLTSQSNKDGSANYRLALSSTVKTEQLPVGLSLQLKVPPGLVTTAFDPTPEAGANLTWVVPTTWPDQGLVVNFKGSGQTADNTTALTTSLFWRDDRTGAQYQLLTTALNLTPGSGPTSVRVSLNGEERLKSLDWGEAARWVFTLTNNNKQPLTDVEVRAHVNPGLLSNLRFLDGNGQEIKSVAYDSTAGVIIATSNAIRSLKSLVPGESVTLPLAGQLVSFPKLPQPDLTKPYSVDSYWEATGTLLDSVGNKTVTVNSPLLKTPLNTYWKLRAEARYYNDENLPVGSGPLPPQVGQVTRYRLYWYLTNTLHNIQAVRVTAQLPANVRWVGAVDNGYGTIAYQESDRTVRWELNQLPAASDIAGRTVDVSFDVELSPRPDQVGDDASLLGNSQAIGIDAVTGGTLNLSVNQLTTALETDPVAPNKGTIKR